MKSSALAILFALSTTLLPLQARAQMAPEAAAALQRPIAIEREKGITSVPLIPHMGKFSIDAAMNGVERRFVFDTGSPTMISRELAAQLDLKIIGSNTGRDANGREFTTYIAIVDRLTIGAVTFRSVPVLIGDFGIADPGGCVIDAGVIGSEIFPGSVWHIDGERQMLQIAERFADLPDHIREQNTIVAPLHDYGYPHAPVFDYAIGEFEDKGLFDTGNSDTVVLFDRVIQDNRVAGAIIPETLRVGRGSHGVSAAGLGADTNLMRFEIEGMRLGTAALGRHRGTTRNAPPSLIGLGILDTHDVSLDYLGARILLHPRQRKRTPPPHPGYGLMQLGGDVRVVQLFDGSPAQRAGLKLGDKVVAIDDRTLSTGDSSCETARWLAEDRPIRSAQRLTVVRDNRPTEISLIEP
ncbi:PDZ domain-containing protein [Erythrobacter vulgaris]|uniref:PDZ domain-containing protein n=1 Tax=Qipengyuania vulgaris TaxID=291985 RepID=A0A844XW49_9SPHN|nr:retropepsin-like aspartic protease [Qipengyuania vulgaris]MXO49172.1 PDZ domain-containing protein [Qipengyuania vulgaris]